MSLGGEYRLKLESYSHLDFGLTHTPNFDAWSNRLILHADLHIGSALRAFVQLGYSDETGRRPAERPFDSGGIDLTQGFIDWTTGPADELWRVRLGRQEIAIGRYVTIRDARFIIFLNSRRDAPYTPRNRCESTGYGRPKSPGPVAAD